jgi:hypothetical protein
VFSRKKRRVMGEDYHIRKVFDFGKELILFGLDLEKEAFDDDCDFEPCCFFCCKKLLDVL